MYKEVKSCRVCHSVKLKKYLDLGEQPLVNSLVENARKYPLQVLFCEECNLSQLSVVVNPELLYKDYPYHSSVSKTFQNHCRGMAIEAKSYFDDGYDPMVIDIASNDGCLLEQFKKEGYYTMGVEPADNLAKEANKKGINTVNAFWDRETATRVPACDVITATNVFAHVDDIRSFLSCVRGKLKVFSKGMLIVEFPYLPNLIEGNQFDTIYHEHLSYFLLKPIQILFDSCGLNIFRVDKTSIHGGSIRIWATPYSREVEPSVQAVLDEEEKNGYYNLNTYLNFSNNVEFVKRQLKEKLREIAMGMETVMGYGASAKGAMLLNVCGIEKHDIISIVDETPDKIGKVIPGIGIPIVGFEHFDVVQPDYILLLAWNFKKELILKTVNHKINRGQYIVPIPKVEII